MATALKHKQRSSRKYQQEQKSLANNVGNMIRNAASQKMLKASQMTFGRRLMQAFCGKKGDK